MYTFQCWACQQTNPSIHKHEHHRIPKSLGGRDTPDNLLRLCPTCHDLLHNVAYKLARPGYSTVLLEDMVKIIYDDQGTIKRIFELATYVRDEIIKQRETGKKLVDFVEISVVLRQEYKAMLHDLAKSQQVSLEALLRTILLRAVSQQFNKTIDIAAEERSIKSWKKKGNA